MLLVVEVQRPRHPVAVETAARRVVGVGQDATRHIGVAAAGVAPTDQDVGALGRQHFAERERSGCRPGDESTANRCALVVTSDVSGAGVESEREGRSVPRTGRRERERRHSSLVRQQTPGPRHHLARRLVEESGRRQAVEVLVVRERGRGVGVEHTRDLGRDVLPALRPSLRDVGIVGEVAEPAQELLYGGESIGGLVEPGGVHRGHGCERLWVGICWLGHRIPL
jgi:hypothetical protein